MSSSAGLAAAKRRRASSSVKPVTSSNVSNNKVKLVKESEKAAALSRAPPMARVLYDHKKILQRKIYKYLLVKTFIFKCY